MTVSNSKDIFSYGQVTIINDEVPVSNVKVTVNIVGVSVSDGEFFFSSVDVI